MILVRFGGARNVPLGCSNAGVLTAHEPRHKIHVVNGELDPLALVTLADTMPPSVTQYLGPGAPMFFAPSCDLTVHVLGSTREEWVLVQVTCSAAGDGYASARARIWDRCGALLVEATQLMYFRVGGPEGLAAPRSQG